MQWKRCIQPTVKHFCSMFARRIERPQSSKYDDGITNPATQNFSIGFSALFLSFSFLYPIPLDRLPRSRFSTRGRSLSATRCHALPYHILPAGWMDGWRCYKKWLWPTRVTRRPNQQSQTLPISRILFASVSKDHHASLIHLYRSCLVTPVVTVVYRLNKQLTG